MSKKSLSKLEIALRNMEARIESGYENLCKKPREAIRLANEYADKSAYGYGGIRGGSSGPSGAIDMHCHQLDAIKKKRDSAIRFVRGIRSFQELIEANLMSVGEAVRTVTESNSEKARLAVGEMMSSATIEASNNIREGLDNIADAILGSGEMTSRAIIRGQDY